MTQPCALLPTSCRSSTGAEPGSLLCGDCADLLHRYLLECRTYIAALTPVRPVRPEARRAGGYASASPAADDVIVLLDGRSSGGTAGPDDSPAPLLSAPGVLGTWARLVAEELAAEGRWVDQAATLADALHLLITRRDWIGCQRWVDEYAGEITTLHHQLRRAAYDDPPPPRGRCIDVQGGVTCDGPVYDRHDGARCGKCGRRYDGFAVLDLRRVGA